MKTIVALNCACVDVFEQLNELHPGGEALNFCGNICDRKDLSVYLMGAISKDKYGDAILASLKKYPVNLKYLRFEQGETANHQILLTDEGDRYFPENAWHGGVYESYTLGDEECDFIKRADVVHTTIGAPIFPKVVELRKEADFTLAVDFNDYRDFDTWEAFVPYIDVFFISGSEDILDKLKTWSEKYSGVFVATLAAKGSVAFYHGKKYIAEAEHVTKIVDTTGCGDSYQAGFMASYCMDQDILNAMLEGSRQAAKTLSHLGGF